MLHVALLAVLASAAAAPPASAELLVCERGTEPAAEFEAEMSSTPGAERMRMRFTLQAAMRGKRGYRRVAAPGLDTWTTSDPGVARYVFTRRVEELIGPARYRVKVRFQWLDANGDTLARATRTSRACRISAASTLRRR